MSTQPFTPTSTCLDADLFDNIRDAEKKVIDAEAHLDELSKPLARRARSLFSSNVRRFSDPRNFILDVAGERIVFTYTEYGDMEDPGEDHTMSVPRCFFDEPSEDRACYEYTAWKRRLEEERRQSRIAEEEVRKLNTERAEYERLRAKFEKNG